jgi:hypothetical protein
MRNKFGLRYRTAANDETKLAKELGRADPHKKMLVEAAVRPWLRRVAQTLRREDAAGELLDGRGPTASTYWARRFGLGALSQLFLTHCIKFRSRPRLMEQRSYP